jgi:hypothetical protein
MKSYLSFILAIAAIAGILGLPIEMFRRIFERSDQCLAGVVKEA